MRSHTYDRDIIHAGMFFGDFLPGLSKSMADNRVIYGFEPNTENFRAAQWTLVLNNISNVKAYNFGLGEVDSSAQMLVRDNGIARGGGSSILWDGGDNVPTGDKEKIEIRSIDNVIPMTANIGIIQLDVEGYEWRALRGALSTIKRCAPIIMVESFFESEFDKLLRVLGYKKYGEVCGNTILTPSE
jgi:FkbM family methyltransferase